MTRIVLDASAALEVVLRRPRGSEVLALIEEADDVLAPDLFVVEVANALWKHVRVGDLALGEAQSAFDRAAGLVVVLTTTVEIAKEALVIAATVNHPVYDALYGVCARRSHATVCTLDRRMRVMLETLGVAAWVAS